LNLTRNNGLSIDQSQIKNLINSSSFKHHLFVQFSRNLFRSVSTIFIAATGFYYIIFFQSSQHFFSRVSEVFIVLKARRISDKK